MAAYITGMIVGAVCIVSSLVYLMGVNLCITALLAQKNVDPTTINTFDTVQLAVAVAAAGAVVLIVSVAMAAFTGLRRLRPMPGRKDSEPAETPSAASAPELEESGGLGL